VESHGLAAVVQPDKCAACLTCVRMCLFNAPRIKNNKAVIEPSACQVCGTCVEECPHQAITLQGYNDFMHLKMIQRLMK
jgi:heterodisulfide reductase subunit A